ncbi:MAG: outer membrane protein assembly factor BamB family protein [Planctomycetota bacterium]|jgi:outer membrane protein assembly factor BamB
MRRDKRISRHGPVSILSAAVLTAALAMGETRAPAAEVAETTRARDVLQTTGFRGGLIVHLGCGDGRLTAALGQGDGRVVHGLDADSQRIDRARAYLRGLGLCGSVSVTPWSGKRLPYADDLVNLLVAEDLAEVSMPEVMRVLVPNGVACVKGADGRWRKTVKPWPARLDEWTHWNHGADQNPVSRDAVVGPPRELQWTDGPAWSKKHWGSRISAMVTAGGRLFCVQDETPTSLFNIAARWVLVARDAFNGVVLWRRELPEWTAGGWGPVTRRAGAAAAPEDLVLGVYGELSGGSGVRDATRAMVAAGDRLYVPLSEKGPLSALDAATGRLVGTYEGITPVQEVVCAEGVLLVGGRGRLRAFDAETGDSLWESSGANACVVCVDPRKGETLWETALDRAMGETKAPPGDEKAGFAGPLQAGEGVVLASYGQGRTTHTVALSAAQGDPLWHAPFGGKPFGRGSGPFFIDGSVWSLDSAKGVLTSLDPQTGRTKREVAAPAIRYVGHHARCYYARATCRYIIAKERGADFVDLDSGEVSWNNWVRGPCRRGVLPANGLLYAGQHSCRCYTETALHGFWALAPARRAKDEKRIAHRQPRLQRGAVRAADLAGAPDRRFAEADGRRHASDWPTYRHDAARSGSTAAALSGVLEPKWTAALRSRPTAPVVARGKVYAAAVDRHTVVALEAESGEPAWRYTAGGRVDSPPTIHGGLALFGCRDGWVYCLGADDGRLVWRFRAAPEERMVGAGGQIESAWPVPGSILVRDGVAYCVAGRSSFLDGGLYLYGLEPTTGRLLYAKHLEGPGPGPEVGTAPDTPNRGYVIAGALADVLTADAEHVYLRHLRFDPALREAVDAEPNLYKSPELTGENRGGDHKYWDNLLEAGRHALFSDPAWFHRSFFQNFPGMRLYAATGLLDGSWHRRMYWAYGQVVGQYVVFRGNVGYAVQVFATSPREGGFNAGDGYVVYAGQTAARQREEKLFALRPDQSKWRTRVPLRPTAMTLAGDVLLLAGPPDLDEPGDALAAVEGRKGALLWTIDAETGRKLAQRGLPSAPVFDGMAVAGGRLFISTMDGTIACLGPQP